METHEKIRLIRELNKWSQEEMAEKLAMSAGGYAKIERGETQLNIPRLEQLAAIFKVDMWDLLKSGNNGMVLQINEGDSGGDIALYASSDMAMKLELLNQELKHCREMLEQKDKEIELLRQLAASVRK
ncbi:TPA: helix-turn-helix transcriptional regulator [Neisseria subflava]|jgi:DNA-binding protein|uniref:helix-turn-helix domain-containing protein n=1 Tax=unclassified Neisseria TaxID=2623750 RepID=UPI0008A3337C|nr:MULTISPECIES: helix-turn-helix transcriptional regulator [unclassified Neisseria]OFK86159.1 transcriptional regulator [Neisseria sp. HMSC061E12]OHO82368.1 transcriptional regulator [Neisseria sp. HMSC056A04]OHR17398.1 transcriptional regulator [Neisseria sp. HMSC078H04]